MMNTDRNIPTIAIDIGDVGHKEAVEIDSIYDHSPTEKQR